MKYEKRQTRLRRQILVLTNVIIFVGANIAWGERSYYYIEQVGQGYE